MMPPVIRDMLRSISAKARYAAQVKMDKEHPCHPTKLPDIKSSMKFYRIRTQASLDFVETCKVLSGSLNHCAMVHSDHGASYQMIVPHDFDPSQKNQDFYMVEFIWEAKAEKKCPEFEGFVATIRDLLQPL